MNPLERMFHQHNHHPAPQPGPVTRAAQAFGQGLPPITTMPPAQVFTQGYVSEVSSPPRGALQPQQEQQEQQPVVVSGPGLLWTLRQRWAARREARLAEQEAAREAAAQQAEARRWQSLTVAQQEQENQEVLEAIARWWTGE